MTEQRKSLSPFDIWHVSSKPILLSHVLPAPWRSASPRVWDLVGWVQSGIQERILHTAQALLVSVGQKTPLEEEGSIKISSVRGSAKKKPCWQLQTPQSVCAFSGSPSPSRTACEFQSRPSPGFNWIFFKRSVLSNKYITFETLFHNKLISRSSWMPYCVLKRKKRIPDSQNIFNKHFREFPPPPETPN